MSVDIHPTRHDDDVAAPATSPAGPVTRVIAGSLTSGALTALLLTLVVFAGATESVITGAILLAFGLGWAMIAVLTVRHTYRPQRWAAVPAAAMGATGVLLLARTPENDVMTWLSWVWPPFVLALAGWMFARMRRSSTGRGRWLLTPMIAALALAAVGATCESLVAAHDQATYPAPGRIYQVNGHRLHLDCRGQGGPTVVLANGLGEISASWARVAGPVAQTTRVCAYDRAGQGWSDDVPSPQDGITAADDLHALLDVAGESGPYVLVGHSIGGTYAMTYAARYPEQVAGLVLLDSSSPQQFSRLPDYAGQYALMRRGLALLPTLNRLGVGRVFADSPLPAPAADQVEALTSTAYAARNGRDEVSMLPEVFEQAQQLTGLGGRPLAVVTASENLTTTGWSDAQDRLAGLSANRVHRVADSTHAGLLEDEHGSTESVRAIAQVVAAVRAGSPLDPG
jgi:pimeloyl-ACP methyl ester carboxylesterase